MIEHAKDALNAVVWNRVIKSRREIEQNHRCGKDADADDVPGRSRARRRNNQNGRSCDSQQESDAMANAIGNFFSDSLIRGFREGFTHCRDCTRKPREWDWKKYEVGKRLKTIFALGSSP